MRRTVARFATPVALGTTLAFVVGTGTAWGYYDAVVQSTGTATVTTAGNVPLSIAATGSVSAGLYPGGPGADVTISVGNPHDVPVTVTAVSSAGAVVATPLAGRSCGTHGVALGTPTSGLPATIAAGATASVTFTGVATMDATAESGCQGASFSIPLRVAARL